MPNRLTFEPEGHLYALDGKPIISVTQALEREQFVDTTWFDEHSALRGNIVHELTELDDRDDLIEDSIDPTLAGYLEGWRRFRRETGYVPELIEHRVYSETYGYAGTIDRIAGSILDIKTGVPGRGAELQTAAYQHAYFEMTGIWVPKRLAVQLFVDGRYKEHPYTDRNDINVFRAGLVSLRWKEAA